jgi:hypothetical protein
LTRAFSDKEECGPQPPIDCGAAQFCHKEGSPRGSNFRDGREKFPAIGSIIGQIVGTGVKQNSSAKVLSDA